MGGNYKEQMNFAPANMYFTYMKARENPALIHYAGSDKPWNNPYTDMSMEFWQNAKETLVYEIIMGRMIDARNNHKINEIERNLKSRKYLLKWIIGEGRLGKFVRKILRFFNRKSK